MSTKPIYEEIATAGDGEDIVAPLIGELRLPRDEILRTRGRGDLSIYERVKRDDQVQSCLQQRINAVVAREWEVDPGGTKRQDKKAADFLREQLKTVRFDDVTRKMLNGVWYGFGVGECLWAPDGGNVTLETIKVRRPARFGFGIDGRLRLLRQGRHDSEVMPDNKFWVFQSNAEDDDDLYGRGLAYWCYWPVWFKRNGLKFWSVFMEKFAAPTAKGTVPQGASDDEKRKLMQALRAITFDSALVVPDGTQAELLQAATRAAGDYHTFYGEMNAAIAKVILSQTMTTDNGSSRAQAEVHEDVKLEVVKADADLICESFSDQVTRWLTDWNYPGAAYPKVWRDVSEPEDLKARADRDKVIFDMGYRPTQDYIDTVYGEGFAPTQTQTQTPDGAPTQPDFAEPAREAEEQRDDLADQIEDVARPHTDAWIDEIRRVLDTSSDFGEAIRRLEVLHPELGVADVARTIGDGLAVANLNGRSDAADSR